MISTKDSSLAPELPAHSCAFVGGGAYVHPAATPTWKSILP